MSHGREWTKWVTVLVSACLAGSCRGAGVLDPQGPVAAAERLILLNATAIMLVVVVPVIVLTLAFAWWYRASNKRATYSPDWSYSGGIELVVWSIPAMVVILLAGVAWTASHLLDPPRELKSDAKTIRIEVVSLDWKWLFIYPDQRVAAVNDLVVPAGTPVEFMLTSATVMNSFFVPQLGSQIYTMPGMTTRLNLMADSPGDYPGLSAHFSGDGFSDMRFVVHAVPESEFSSWLARAQDEGTVLDADTYSQLARAGSIAQTQTYSGVDPMLFENIVQTTAQPLAAPRQEN
ncbi:MAG: cytochrome o ubiquinol oxidase subunit [Gammaproteobacteria bacterium]|jgi:cytochrome o ubiquinol oxidase subunit 2|nr:cytochrome o ubiquinol oxidase subunit [Gammaproteobacteria bacterium]